MPLILGANSLAGGGYEIDNSLRFNDGSSDYLNKTFLEHSKNILFFVKKKKKKNIFKFISVFHGAH